MTVHGDLRGSNLLFADGVDGEVFGYFPEDSGREIRRRLPKAIHKELTALELNRRPSQRPRLDENVLAWIHWRGHLEWMRGPQMKAAWAEYRDAQDLLRRFRRVAGAMRRQCASPTLGRSLHDAEDLFARWAVPAIVFPLAESVGGPLLAPPRFPRRRPSEDWKKRAVAALAKGGIPAKLAGRIVTAIAADARPRKSRSF